MTILSFACGSRLYCPEEIPLIAYNDLFIKSNGRKAGTYSRADDVAIELDCMPVCLFGFLFWLMYIIMLETGCLFIEVNCKFDVCIPMYLAD